MKPLRSAGPWVVGVCAFAVVAALLAGSPQARRSTYFVAPSGSDSGSGTAADPWRTIKRCVDQATAGDTCTLGPGTFAEFVTISRSGTDGHPIRVVGQNGGTPVIEGNLIVSGNYVVVENLRVSMPSGAVRGLRLAGRSGVARRIHITTRSSSLGLNNVAAEVAGSNNTLTYSLLDGTCFGMSVGGTGNVISYNEVTGLWPNGGRCGDIDYVRVFGANHQLRNNVLQGIDRSQTGSAHVDCFQTFDNNGPERAVRNLLIDGNFCSDASQGVMFQAPVHRQSRNVVIRNNVFTRIGAWCALLEDIDEVRILNNTCDTSTAHHGMWCRSNSDVGSCEFKNNIFYGRGTAYGVMGRARLIDGTASEPGRNNLLFATEGAKAFAGYARDHINTDPGFVNRAADDYRLLASSPARDAGIAIDNWETPEDHDGVPRPQGDAWDIGAYEYTASGPRPPRGLRIVRPGPPPR